MGGHRQHNREERLSRGGVNRVGHLKHLRIGQVRAVRLLIAVERIEVGDAILLAEVVLAPHAHGRRDDHPRVHASGLGE